MAWSFSILVAINDASQETPPKQLICNGVSDGLSHGNDLHAEFLGPLGEIAQHPFAIAFLEVVLPASVYSSPLVMRRFLLHVLPGGFHRIRHYGLLANSNRRDNLALARELLHVAPPLPEESAGEVPTVPEPTFVCTHCGKAVSVASRPH